MNKKRFEGTKALTFSSIMSAISIVLILVSFFSGDVGLFLIFILPLCASLVAVYVDFKYSLIYFISTFLISCFDLQLALFIVIPSLVSGIIFGKLIKIYLQGYYIIIINTLALLLLQIGATYLIDLIYKINLVDSIGKILKLNEVTFNNAYILFLFLLSLIEISLNYLIISSELKKFDFEFKETKDHFILNFFIEIILIIASITLMFFNHQYGFLFVGISLFFGVVLAYYNFSFYQNKRIVIIQMPLYLISLISIMILFSYIKNDYRPYLILIILISQLIPSLYIIIYQKIVKKGKISHTLFDKIK